MAKGALLQSGAFTDGPSALTANEIREIVSLVRLMRLTSIKLSMLPALAAYADEMAFDYGDVKRYYADLLKILEGEIKPGPNGDLTIGCAAAPTLALLGCVIELVPAGVFREGSFPSTETVQKCLSAFHEQQANLTTDN